MLGQGTRMEAPPGSRPRSGSRSKARVWAAQHAKNGENEPRLPVAGTKTTEIGLSFSLETFAQTWLASTAQEGAGVPACASLLRPSPGLTRGTAKAACHRRCRRPRVPCTAPRLQREAPAARPCACRGLQPAKEGFVSSPKSNRPPRH